MDSSEHQHALPLLKDLFLEQKCAVQEWVSWGGKLGHLDSFVLRAAAEDKGILRC